VLVVPFGSDLEPTPDTSGALTWPLGPFASSGQGNETYRCAVVSGDDAATLLPVVRTAAMDSVFVDSTGAYASLVVRVFWPGEPDVCAGF
jgi:hypothetical protein